jgi:hypothetical protein
MKCHEHTSRCAYCGPVVDCVSVVVDDVTGGGGGGAAICVFVSLDFVTPLAS